ncbi:DUF2231 domain-containing protein [Sporobolomyces koalae]|uniref:DUF2231 domain-containing protein n=1 Tax=Sporobolomyces koalae TaxID=500713 RepID=UPI0031735649
MPESETSHARERSRGYIVSLVDPLARFGMGVGLTSHPLHPATVHMPIGLLSLSFALDSIQVIPRLAQGLTWLKVMPPAAAVNTLSHYVGAGGLLFSIPTILTGLSELYGLWAKQIKDKATVKQTVLDAAARPPPDLGGEKLKLALWHAGLNTVALLVGFWNWRVRRVDRDLILPPMNAWASALTLPAIFYSASLGGELVYKYGVGVKRQGSAKQVVERQKQGE